MSPEANGGWCRELIRWSSRLSTAFLNGGACLRLASAIFVSFLTISFAAGNTQNSVGAAPGPQALKQLSLEQLSSIDVTTPSKQPVPAFRSPVAIYVITSDDIQRSGVTTIPDALRLAPG